MSMHDTLALVGATIYRSPADAPIDSGTVLVAGGKIVAVDERENISIPSNSTVLDCSGLTLTTGFWNSHVHFLEPKWENAANLTVPQLTQYIQAMLTRYGFVHVHDTGSDLQNTLIIRDRIESGEIPGPSIRTPGMPFVASGGSPIYIAPLRLPELSSPEAAVQAAQQRIASGADAIKIFAASPVGGGDVVVMPTAIAEAVVSAAHALGKPVIAHPTTNEGIRVVLESGIDILAHTSPDGGEVWTDAFVQRLRSASIALIPTLKLWNWEGERQGSPVSAMQDFMNIALQQLRAYAQAGGEILFGTDVGYMTDYDPTAEYALMAESGMSFQEILASLTTVPAARFGVSGQTGKIAVGMDADIVLLAGDPADDIRKLSDVCSTLRQGKILFESEEISFRRMGE